MSNRDISRPIDNTNVGNIRNDQLTERSTGADPFERILSNPPLSTDGTQKFSKSTSYAMTSQTGPDGQPIVSEAQQTTISDGKGFHESRYEAHTPEEDRAGLLRGNPDQAVAVEKFRSEQDGTEHTKTRFRGLQEGELDRFDQQWTNQTQNSAFWNQSREGTQSITSNTEQNKNSITAPRQ